MLYEERNELKAKDANGIGHPIIIVPVPFSAALLINDPRYVMGDEERDMQGSKFARTANVHFIETIGTMSREFIRNHSLTTVRAIRQIHISEELFIDYGSRFM